MHTPDPIMVANSYAADNPRDSHGAIEAIMDVLSDEPTPAA